MVSIKEKELLLKELCARLPYGVKCKYYDCCENDYNEGTICGFERQEYIQIDGKCIHIEEVKPYLFPLSSMTEEQLFEAQEIMGKNEIKIDDGFLCIVDSDRKIISYLEILALLEWFYKNHFDIYELIPIGLANDATGLNIY